MRSIVLIFRNTVRVTFHRRSSFFVYVLLPVLGVLLALATSGGGAGQPTRVGVINEDNGPYAVDLVQGIDQWGSFRTVPVDRADLDQKVSDNDIDCGIIIPAGYSAGVPRGDIETIEIVSIKGQTVTAALQEYLEQYSAGLATLASAAGGDVDRFRAMYLDARKNAVQLTDASVEDAVRGKTTTITSLGFLIMFVMLGAGTTSQFILTEKRLRTYDRICSAPVRPRHYIVGNGLAGFAIIAAQVLLIAVVLRDVLHVRTYVPDLFMIIDLLLFGLVAVGLGLLFAAYAKSSSAATALATLTFTPTCMLAGCFWPISLMPPFMQKLALFTPQRWALQAVEAVQNGSGIGAALPDLVVLLAFAVTFAVVAAFGFARTERSGQFV